MVHEKTNISSSVDGELQLDTPFVGFFLEIRVVELEDELRLVESAVLLQEHHVHLVHVRCVFALNRKVLYLETIPSFNFAHEVCFMDSISQWLEWQKKKCGKSLLFGKIKIWIDFCNGYLNEE